MKKILTFCAAVLASVSMWAAYAPTADEVIILKDVYDASATEAGFSKHAAIAWGGTASTNSRKAGDPNNNGEATSSNVNCYSVKGNGKGKNITVSFEGCSQIIVYHEKQSSYYVELRADSKTGDLLGKSASNTYFTAVDLNANNSYSIFLHGTTGSADQDFYVYAVKLIKGETCDDPELTVLPTEGTGFVGDPIDITISSKNQSKPINPVVTVDGVTGLYGTDYNYSASIGLVQATPLKAGTFVITFSQVSDGTYCAAEESATFVISEKTPVASVTVDGPTAAYVGTELTYTATAANATDYAWYVDGVAVNNNSNTFVYTAVKGNHVIFCEARNKFNKDGETETWIKSNEINLAVTNVSGQLITYNAVQKNSNTAVIAADANNIIGGTVEQQTQSNAKVNSGGYFKLTLANAAFLAGDTVRIVVTPEGDKFNVPQTIMLSSVQDNTDIIGQTDGISATSADNITVDVILEKDAKTVWLSRDETITKQNPIVVSISVIRPVAVKSTAEEFKGATINGDALNVSDFIELEGNQRVNVLETSYVEAPVVVFTKTVTTTYEDDSKTTKDVEVEVTAFNPADTERWQARTTINGVDYVVSCYKTASVVVTYMDGETVLGTENVAANGNPANYAQYQSKSLASFVGWYSNADLADEHAVADMSAEVITAATTYYAKFENKYAVSVNIEKLILDNSKDYDVKANVLNGTNGYASNYNSEGMDISNDSLNNSKGAMRNYAYLGLKIKSKSLLNFRVAQGQTVLIKFGYVGTTPQVSINGGEYAAMTITEGVYSYTATGDDLLSMYVSVANKAVVLKQIVIGEAPALEDVVYDINCGEVQNGTLSCNWAIALPGETVALTVTPAEGYKIENVTLNGETVEAVENVYSFIMPEKVANVAATFVKDTPSALGNTEAEAKAVKVVRDGQLLILKNGVLYNAQGAIVK